MLPIHWQFSAFLLALLLHNFRLKRVEELRGIFTHQREIWTRDTEDRVMSCLTFHCIWDSAFFYIWKKNLLFRLVFSLCCIFLISVCTDVNDQRWIACMSDKSSDKDQPFDVPLNLYSVTEQEQLSSGVTLAACSCQTCSHCSAWACSYMLHSDSAVAHRPDRNSALSENTFLPSVHVRVWLLFRTKGLASPHFVLKERNWSSVGIK